MTGSTWYEREERYRDTEYILCHHPFGYLVDWPSLRSLAPPSAFNIGRVALPSSLLHGDWGEGHTQTTDGTV